MLKEWSYGGFQGTKHVKKCRFPATFRIFEDDRSEGWRWISTDGSWIIRYNSYELITDEFDDPTVNEKSQDLDLFDGQRIYWLPIPVLIKRQERLSLYMIIIYL